ncbi:hypothetical protein [Streptomyces sp. NPDC001508]|uniref:hypothetical protein n=1 Tax=Streptomyces sp. NPDC001508 TaxID=3154656 RepID=UPI003331F676
MSDRRADIDPIRECSPAPTRTRDTFAERARPAEGYGVGETGSQKVPDAFETFGGNRPIHSQEPDRGTGRAVRPWR